MAQSVASPAPPNGTLTRLRQIIRRRPVLVLLALLALVSGIFVLAPGLDIAVSRLFYEPGAAGFVGRSGLAEVLRDLGHYAVWLVAIAAGAASLVKVAAPASRLLIRPRQVLFLFASLAIGPGLIVNLLLKNVWGRARPREIVEFGGNATFSPAWWPSDQCHLNCSFVSGEAAAAFFLVSLALIAPPAWRPAVAIVTTSFAALVSAARIAGGGHFLSDVLIAWNIVLLVVVILHRLIVTGLPTSFDERIEAAAARVGVALRRPFHKGP